jgi:hypothetical protein
LVGEALVEEKRKKKEAYKGGATGNHEKIYE